MEVTSHHHSFSPPQVIELQNEKMESMDAERINMQAKFREELDKASRAMRQEVERMREVSINKKIFKIF